MALEWHPSLEVIKLHDERGSVLHVGIDGKGDLVFETVTDKGAELLICPNQARKLVDFLIRKLNGQEGE